MHTRRDGGEGGECAETVGDAEGVGGGFGGVWGGGGEEEVGGGGVGGWGGEGEGRGCVGGEGGGCLGGRWGGGLMDGSRGARSRVVILSYLQWIQYQEMF